MIGIAVFLPPTCQDFYWSDHLTGNVQKLFRLVNTAEAGGGTILIVTALLAHESPGLAKSPACLRLPIPLAIQSSRRAEGGSYRLELSGLLQRNIHWEICPSK